eukprot:scaffold14.g1211.t1
MKTLAASILVLACAAGGASGALVGPDTFHPWYTCNPGTSSSDTASRVSQAAVCAPPACLCPMNNPPGGLTPAQIPQFVLIQHSNAMEEESYAIMERVRQGYATPNGSASAYQRGDEIAMQTNRYTPTYPFEDLPVDPGNYNNAGPDGKSSLLREVNISRTWWHTECGVPMEHMVGFRSPELVHNPPVRAVLQQLGFLYDATITEYWAFYSPTSPSKDQASEGRERRRPGPPLLPRRPAPRRGDCNFSSVSFCTNQERYPGLWEVPIYQLQNASGGFLGAADYGNDPAVGRYDVLKALKENFDDRYNGGRTPMTVALNLKWLNVTANANDLRSFIGYAASKPDTWFVTTQDLVYWMQSPVPLDQAGAFFTCSTPGIRNRPPGSAASPAPASPSAASASPVPVPGAASPLPSAASPAAAPLAFVASPLPAVAGTSVPAPAPAAARAAAPMTTASIDAASGAPPTVVGSWAAAALAVLAALVAMA